MADSSALIDRLLKAEKDAAEIIKNAQTSRREKVQNAKAAAKKELEAYEEEIKHLTSASAGQADEAQNQRELAAVDSDYNSNKDATVKYIVEKVRDVNLSLTPTQILALSTG